MDLSEFNEELKNILLNDFWAFRKFINGKDFIKGYFPKAYARFLQDFSIECDNTKRPIYICSVPPQHGKSTGLNDFIAWCILKDRWSKHIFTTYNKGLGVRANKQIQGILSNSVITNLFGHYINSNNVRTRLNYQRNAETIEFINDKNIIGGYFKNSTIGEGITGHSADRLYIDDVFKGWKDAKSKVKRDSVKDWYLSEAISRLSDFNGGQLIVMTRWDLDDLIGFIKNNKELSKRVRIMNFKAIAEEDEDFRKKGEPLFPEHKSLQFLQQMKASFSNEMWKALYQGEPYNNGGLKIKGEWFPRYEGTPRTKFKILATDTAQKKGEHNDYTVMGCGEMGIDGRIYITDWVRKKLDGVELENTAIAFFNKHRRARRFEIEDKSSGSTLIQQLKQRYRIPVKPIQPKGDKVFRVNDVLSYIENGYIVLPEGANWVHDFITECEEFSEDMKHDHDDQIDVLVMLIYSLLIDSKKSNSIDIARSIDINMSKDISNIPLAIDKTTIPKKAPL